MDEISKIHVGLDVHKDSISVGAAEPGRSGGRLIAKTAHDLSKLTKVLMRVGRPEQLHLVYEAGPTGYLGLVPTEASSGDRVHRGSITKTGNAHGICIRARRSHRGRRTGNRVI